MFIRFTVVKFLLICILWYFVSFTLFFSAIYIYNLIVPTDTVKRVPKIVMGLSNYIVAGLPDSHHKQYVQWQILTKVVDIRSNPTTIWQFLQVI